MKRLLLPLVALILSMASHAQVGELRDNLAIGFNGGYNLSRVDFSPTIKQELQPGAAQVEINFAQRGWNELIEDGSNNTYHRTTNYIEIPFFAHLGWGKEERGLQFFVNAGPQLGLFLSDKEHYGFTSEYPWNPNSRPNYINEQYGKDIENTLEYGIAGGLGMELKTSVGNFIIEGRYFFGLSDMFGNSKADPFGRSANTTITGKISYLIDITK